MYHIWVCETEKDFLCACIYTSNTFQMGQENMLHCLPSPSAPSLLVELILIFLWKACVRCHFTWVEWNKRSFVAGSGFGLEGVCVYILEVWWCVPCGQTTNCCAEQYMAYRRGVSEARGSCQRCLSVTVLLRQGMLLKSMQPEILFGRGLRIAERKKKEKVRKCIIQGHVEWWWPKRRLFISAPDKLDCFCAAHFPLDGKLDGKLMKHKEKTSEPKRQTDFVLAQRRFGNTRCHLFETLRLREYNYTLL